MEEKEKRDYTKSHTIKCVCPNCRNISDLDILDLQDIKDYQATILCTKCYQEKLQHDAEIYKTEWYNEKQLRLKYEEILKNKGIDINDTN